MYVKVRVVLPGKSCQTKQLENGIPAFVSAKVFAVVLHDVCESVAAARYYTQTLYSNGIPH